MQLTSPGSPRSVDMFTSTATQIGAVLPIWKNKKKSMKLGRDNGDNLTQIHQLLCDRENNLNLVIKSTVIASLIHDLLPFVSRTTHH